MVGTSNLGSWNGHWPDDLYSEMAMAISELTGYFYGI
jgi:hypothetical protein